MAAIETPFDVASFLKFYSRAPEAIFRFTSKNLVSQITTLNEEDFKKSTIVHTRKQRATQPCHPIIELDGEFSRVDFVPGLKTTLYVHQQTAVMAMLQLELFRNFTIRSSQQINFNAAVLSEPPGSGKTIEILALILLSRIPKPMPDILAISDDNDCGVLSSLTTRFNQMFTVSIVICGSSVLRQWLATMRLMTDLKVLCIADVRGLRELFSLIESRRLNEYDVVLAKNGYITVPVTLPGGELFSPVDNHKNKSIVSAIGMALKHYCVARVIVDDFDTIKLPAQVRLINALFTWYVSATRNPPHQRNFMNSSYYKSAVNEFITYHESAMNIFACEAMFKTTNVRNSEDYIKETAKIPYPKYHTVHCINNEARFVNLLNLIGNREIMEMINADAIGEAAARIGIKTDSVSDVFASLLGNRFTTYKDAIEHLKFIDYNQVNADLRLPITDHPEPPPHHYGKKNLQNYDDIEYQYAGIDRLLAECHAEYKEIRDSNGKEIERVKDNLKHGACPVCTADLQEIDNAVGIIVNKCCSATFCGTCGFRMQKEGICVACRRHITTNSLIFIGEDVKLEDIQDDNFEVVDDAQDDTSVADTVPTAVPMSVYEKFRAEHISKVHERKTKPSKIDAMFDILFGVEHGYMARVDMHIPSIMKGACYLPDAPYRKVMVFANFEEAIGKIIKHLTDAHVKFWRLQGTSAEISQTAFQFNNCTTDCVLVINSAKHCAGLNLQTATDHIFWHYIENINVESQVIGRGQRLGRTSCLRVWYLCYDNEMRRCEQIHNMRPLTGAELEMEKKFMEHAVPTTIDQIVTGVKKIYDYMVDMCRGKIADEIEDAEDEPDDEQSNSASDGSDSDE